MKWHKFFGAALAVGLLAGAQVAAAQGSTQPQTGGSQSAQQQGTPGVTVIQEPSATGQTGQSGMQAQAGQQQQPQPLALTVTQVDKVNNRVYFEAPLDPAAQIQGSSGEQLSVGELQPGDSVRASFDPNTGQVEQMTVLQSGSSSSGMQQPSSGSSGSMGSSGSTGSSSSGSSSGSTGSSGSSGY